MFSFLSTKTNWYSSQSSSEPEPILVGPHTVFLRRNVVKSVKNIDPDDTSSPTFTTYDYEELKMPIEEFNKIVTAQLLLNQQASSDERMIMMEAMADLYESTLSN